MSAMATSERRGAFATVIANPVSVDWYCPYCDKRNSTPIDHIVWKDLWDGCESAECSECGREVRFSEGVEYE